MKRFLVTTDEEQFFIEAENEHEASCKVIEDKFPTLLDDELSDAFDIVEVTSDTQLEKLERMMQQGMFVY